ncbi:hypothetical protein ACHAXN_008667 [Cyclotella atomus]
MDDELQDFIADCEWKTRKILRESNKRIKDSAQLHAAKERVELLKLKGSKGAVIPTPRTPNKTKDVKSNISCTSNNLPKEWKGRDKIIHDACETIKKLKVEDNAPTKPNQKLKDLSTKLDRKTEKIHAALCGSPFNDGKSSLVPTPKKPASRKSKGRRENNAEHAVITRRTIERDFYIMSKKRSKPKPKRRQNNGKAEDAKPELKSSVLWKKYRCIDRVMEAKGREAEKLYEKFERLKPFDDNNAADDSESSSEDEEERGHALQDMLDARVAEENLRFQRRNDKMLKQIKFIPDVQTMWDQLEEGHGKVIPRGASKRGSQVQSVSLETATKNFVKPSLTYSAGVSKQKLMPTREGIRYISPYKEPVKTVRLICNEPVISPSKETEPLTLSISHVHAPDSNGAVGGCWVYEMYNPYNGSIQIYRLNDVEFITFVSRCEVQIGSPKEFRSVKKLVHSQEVEVNGSKLLYTVVVSLDGLKISATIHRAKAHANVDAAMDIHDLNENFEEVCCYQAIQVLHLLDKQQLYSPFDEIFWMKVDNGIVVWNPLIDLICEKGKDGLDTAELSRSTSARDSVIAIKHILERSDGMKTMAQIFSAAKEQRGADESTNQHTREQRSISSTPLLSMRISNHSPYSGTICPGHTTVGRKGIWRLTSPIVEEQSNTLYPKWLTDARYPSHLDITQASAHLYYKDLGPQKGKCVVTLSRVAFESPVVSPYCYAIDRGYTVPPFSQPELVDGTIPTVHLPCKSLLEHHVESRFDTMLPPTIVVLDPGASEGDWIDAPIDGSGNVYHVRDKDQFDKDGFRIKTFAHRIKYDDTIKSMVYGISEKAALPNRLATAPFLTHKSTECCTEYLSRKRTADDYHYIAESDGEGTLSVPYLFATHMKAYKPVHVSRKSITSYRDEEQFLLATKEAEAKKAEIALKIRAAEELAEARLKEKMEKIHQSMGLTSTARTKGVDLPSSLARPDAPKSHIHKAAIVGEAEEVETPPNKKLVDGKVDELNQMANMLLNNTNFLRAIARKLNIPEDTIARAEQAPQEAKMPEVQSESDPDEPRAHQPPVVPKLDLSCKTYKGSIVMGLKGDGWKRLPRSDTLIGEFKLTSRKVEKNRNGPKFIGFEGRRNFFDVDAVEEIRHKVDPEIYGVKTTTMFIPDLATERLRLSKSQRQQKHYEKSLLSEDQKFALEEILQIPVDRSNPKQQAAERNKEGNDGAVIDEHEVTEESNKHVLDPVTRAILAVKNHNLQHLESVLDTEGISIETRDQHGNTLFILACQQGSKRLAKFLLRRGANINAQNNGGNTALHYLHEYHHKLLAEYLERKGADNSIRNAEGLTVYEGVSLETGDYAFEFDK